MWCAAEGLRGALPLERSSIRMQCLVAATKQAGADAGWCRAQVPEIVQRIDSFLKNEWDKCDYPGRPGRIQSAPQ